MKSVTEPRGIMTAKTCPRGTKKVGNRCMPEVKYLPDSSPRYLIQTGKGKLLDDDKNWSLALQKAKEHVIKRKKKFPLFIVKEMGQVRLHR